MVATLPFVLLLLGLLASGTLAGVAAVRSFGAREDSSLRPVGRLVRRRRARAGLDHYGRPSPFLSAAPGRGSGGLFGLLAAIDFPVRFGHALPHCSVWPANLDGLPRVYLAGGDFRGRGGGLAAASLFADRFWTFIVKKLIS